MSATAISSAASSAISTPEDSRRATHDRRELTGVVVAEAERHPEPVAERCREEPGARRRPDERERGQVERQRARGGALAEDDVEPEVLERRIEDLLGGPVQPVDLVHEQDVARLEGGQDRCDVLLLERRAGDGAQADAELLADDLRERRLPEPRRPGEEDVVERVVPAAGGLERDPQLLLDPLLADEVVEALGAKRALRLVLVGRRAGARNWLMSQPGWLMSGEGCGEPEVPHALQKRGSWGTGSPTGASRRRATLTPPRL